MDVPSQSEIFMISGDERRLVPDGPAIVDTAGHRRDVPPKALDALHYVETALREGYAVQVSLLRHELPLREAALAAELSEEQVRSALPASGVPLGPDDSDEWVQLDQVLQLQRRIRASRREAAIDAYEEELEADKW
ncbi:hypothetical protein [Kribbella italica]|uniref:Uncharacterized protein n=1 Tax=Kribbella italica TaxID=1540520 RepID=A0A7W9J3R5_9ACTN|nr:hypothetical protein [Kribbella italica]MBB5835102.1 hypothetical protein [Kribbella italica]